jgi:hypothetical protein
MSSHGGDARTRARRGGVRLLAGLAAATVLAGCSGTADSGGADDPGSTQVRGLDGDTITVGAITVASGPMAAAGRSVTAGNEAYFAALDGDGGVAGRYRVEIDATRSLTGTWRCTCRRSASAPRMPSSNR